MTAEENAEMLAEIQELLWPGGDRDHEWESDTIEQVASVLINGGIGPDYTDNP
jgi:hypothetical protein